MRTHLLRVFILGAVLLWAAPSHGQSCGDSITIPTSPIDSIWMPFGEVWKCPSLDIPWTQKDKLVIPIVAGTYRLETKTDTAWVKLGKEAKTGLILYEAKTDTLWRWVKQ